MTNNPNILVFFTDQQRWDTLGLNGSGYGLTPNFDRWAKKGTFFKNAVTPQPVCGPARSCLQTGQYATTTGVTRNGNGLKPDAPKLAEILNKAGYRTSYFGKWHLAERAGPRGSVLKEDRAGYQDWLGANSVEGTSGPYSAVLMDEDNEPHKLPGYRVDAQTDAMIRYLDERAKDPEAEQKPFFIFHSFLEPHHQNSHDNYPAPHGYEEMFRQLQLPPDLMALKGSAPQHWAGYCGMVKRLDEALGRTMDALESTGLADNTIVVFISDHGCHFKTRNGEYKRTPHESSVRVPFAIWGPKWNGGGERLEAANLVDLMPSLLESAGVEIPSEVEGRSLLPLASNASEDWPDFSFIQFGDWGLAPGRAIRTNRWKYAVTASKDYAGKGTAPEYTETHLYDLEADPYELSNLVESEVHEKVKKELQAKMLAKMEEIKEPDCKIIPAEQKNFGQRKVDYIGT